MLSKKLLPVVALLIVASAFVAAGASQPQGVKVPAGQMVDATSANAMPAGQPRVIPAAPALPSAAQKVIFSDDFSSGRLDNFHNLNGYEGSWHVAKGYLKQGGNADQEISDDPAVLIVKGVTLDNGSIEAQVLPSGMPAGIVFRGSDAGFYRLDLYPAAPNKGSRAVLVNVTRAGAAKVIAQAPLSMYAGYAQNTWTLAKVTVQGSKIEVAVDGKTIISATDSSYASGWAGIWSSADMGAQFSNVRVQQDAGH